MDNWINGKYGNPAAASDMLRMMESVVSKYGIYTDFEIEVNLENLKKTITLSTPFIYSNPSNDVILCGMDSSSNLSEDARKILHKYADKVIKKYNSVHIFENLLFAYMHSPQSTYIGVVINKIGTEKKHSVFELRKIVHELSEKDLYNFIMPYKQSEDVAKINIDEMTSKEIISTLVPKLIERQGNLAEMFNGIELHNQVTRLSKEDQIKYYHNAFQCFKLKAEISTVVNLSGPEVVISIANKPEYYLKLYTDLAKNLAPKSQNKQRKDDPDYTIRFWR